VSGDPIVEKKERRRKQNRDAADRCRKKRRIEFDQLKKVCFALSLSFLTVFLIMSRI